MVPIYTAYDPLRAYIVKNVLESAGISVAVVAEWLFPFRGTGGSLSDDSLPEVWVVADGDAPRARQLIEEHRVARHQPVTLWVRCIAWILLLWGPAVVLLSNVFALLHWPGR